MPPTTTNELTLNKYHETGDIRVEIFGVKRDGHPTEYGIGVTKTSYGYAIIGGAYGPNQTCPDPTAFFMHTNGDNGVLHARATIYAATHPDEKDVDNAEPGAALRQRIIQITGKDGEKIVTDALNKFWCAIDGKNETDKPTDCRPETTEERERQKARENANDAGLRLTVDCADELQHISSQLTEILKKLPGLTANLAEANALYSAGQGAISDYSPGTAGHETSRDESILTQIAQRMRDRSKHLREEFVGLEPRDDEEEQKQD